MISLLYDSKCYLLVVGYKRGYPLTAFWLYAIARLQNKGDRTTLSLFPRLKIVSWVQMRSLDFNIGAIAWFDDMTYRAGKHIESGKQRSHLWMLLNVKPMAI